MFTKFSDNGVSPSTIIMLYQTHDGWGKFWKLGVSNAWNGPIFTPFLRGMNIVSSIFPVYLSKYLFSSMVFQYIYFSSIFQYIPVYSSIFQYQWPPCVCSCKMGRERKTIKTCGLNHELRNFHARFLIFSRE